MAPSPGTAAEPCFASDVSNDAREKGSRDGPSRAFVWGWQQEGLSRGWPGDPRQDRTHGGSREQRALEHLYLLGGWWWPGGPCDSLPTPCCAARGSTMQGMSVVYPSQSPTAPPMVECDVFESQIMSC